MIFSKRNKYFLLCLLIVLNLVIRIPSVPHERGSPDEFTMYSLANSLSSFGEARWWANPLSIFGFYPYSYASATAFSFSEISQLTNSSMSMVVWIFPTILGIFAMLSAYLLAGLIKNDDLFRFLIAFIFSISQGLLNYLTWQISARGFFIAIFPFFIYLLLKSRKEPLRFSILVGIIFILLMSTHHYYIFLMLFILAALFTTIIYRFERFIKIPDNIISTFLFIGFIGMFSIPFFTGTFIIGSRYNALYNLVLNNIRYSGPLVFYAIGSCIFLIFKTHKEFGDWFILLSVIFFAPFLYIDKYAEFISSLLICILTGIGIVNVIKIFEGRKFMIFSIIMTTLLLSASFSSYYQHWRTKTTVVEQWYMEDTTYNSALWIKDNLQNKNLIGSNDHSSTRILAKSEVPILVMPETDITYGFVNASNINARKNSPFSLKFYMDGPFVPVNNFHETDAAKWALGYYDVDSPYAKNNILSKFNLSYYIENKNRHEGGDLFIRSLDEKRDLIYSNGIINIWSLLL